jgi:hypothetical protein
MPEEVVGYNRPDAEHILRVAGLPTPTTREHDTYDATRLVLAYTSAGATARVGTTLGTGTATLRYIVAGVLTTSTEEYSFYNLSTGAVASNKYLMLLRVGSDFVCNWEEC